MGFKASSAKRMAASSAIAGSIVVIPSADGSGPILSGGGITAATVVKTQTVSVGSSASSSTTTTSGGLTISTVYVTDSSFNILDDSAVGPSGGYLKVIGTGFKTGCVAYINGSALTTSFVSSTEIRITVPASSVGTYSLMIFNTDGNGAMYLNLAVSNFPTFTTSAGTLGSVYETKPFTQSVSASGDTPLTYSLYSGTLPPGSTLNSDGTITGTSQAESGSSTYSFVVNVKDTQGQDTQRSFSITINTDTVTWSTPTNNQAYSVNIGTAIANVTMSAASAAGYSISYAANTLPTGLSVSGNTIFGTPTTSQTIYTLLTATAATSGRSATRNISWTVSAAPSYPTTVEYLLVAGGGSGGLTGNGTGGGGGGAGGYRTATGMAVTSGTPYVITVGGGGSGSSAGYGANGTSSSFNSVSTIGGGRGGGWNNVSYPGGSGGGGGYGNVWGPSNSSAVSPELGNAGGNGLSSGNYPGGGGGGAGGAGGNASSSSQAGNGGAGLNWNSLGTYYAGGGGGGNLSGSAGSGGAGGGGAGGLSGVGSNGTTNTGGGGGGSAGSSGGLTSAGNGGSGVVIIRYPDTYSAAAATTGSPTVTVSGGYRTYTFTQTGSITF